MNFLKVTPLRPPAAASLPEIQPLPQPYPDTRNSMSHSIDHPDFTALAIGESIGSAPAQALTDTLRGSVAARHEADSIHTTAENLRAALQRQTHPGLDESRRNLVLNVTRSEAIERLGTDDKEDSGIGKTVPMREQASPSPFRIWAGVAAAVAVTVTILKLIPAGGPTKPMATPDELTDAVRLFPSPPQPLPHRAQPPQQIIPAINPQKEQLVEIPAPPRRRSCLPFHGSRYRCRW